MLSRRGLIAGAAALGCGARAAAHIAPGTLQPLVGAGYRPGDADERGLWQTVEQIEAEWASSNRLVAAPDLHRYTVGVLRKLLGAQASDLRVYLVHDPEFNAAMYPNGMTTVNSGLLARVRNEAQLAAVLGHEAGHYLRRHQVAQWRNMKLRTGIGAIAGAATNVGAGVAAAYGQDPRAWTSLGTQIHNDMILSIFRFSREQEAEADAFGLDLIDRAGYAPDQAAAMWQQLIGERQASAAARSKKYHDISTSALSTHPPTELRLNDLMIAAREVAAQPRPGRVYRDGRDDWLRAVAPHRALLLEEQVKQNDPGASLYLINALAADGWTGTLRYFEGEAYRLRDAPGDAVTAARAYADAVALPDAPAQAWRAHGYALMKSGRADDGRRALARYLDLDPAAHDAAMVRFSLLPT